jgi:hypothetical protein
MTTTDERQPVELWRRPLRELLAHLTEQLEHCERPKVKLPHGAFLSLSRRPSGERVLRIARDTRPADEKGWKRWRLELDTFRAQLGLQNWAQAPLVPEAGVAHAFLELLETGPWRAA